MREALMDEHNNIRNFDDYYILRKELNSKHIYVNGCDNKAGALYNICLNKNIFISGFISEELDGRFLGKIILKPGNLPENGVSVSDISELLDFYPGNKKRIIIYGAGRLGASILRYLLPHNENRITIVDTYKAGQIISGIEVQSPIYVKKHLGNCVVIIAMNDYFQVYEYIKTIGFKEEDIYVLRFDISFYENFVYLGGLNSNFITMYEINYLTQLHVLKFFLLYGEYFEKVEEILKNLEINISGILALSNEKIPDGLDYIQIEDLLYENDFVVLCGKKGDILRKEMKLLDLNDDCIECLYSVPMDCRFLNTAALEVNVGPSYKSQNSYAGITRYGEGTRKIFITGGSTTDDTLYRFKSWPEFFFQSIRSNETVSVYNAGVWGYYSAQELYRVIQDAIPLGCDMVISFTGINDMLGRKRAPYANDYETIINRFASMHMKSNEHADASIFAGVEVFEGVPYSEESYFDIWLNNILFMEAICRCKGVRYYAFLQPSPFSQIGVSLREQYIVKACSINKYEENKRQCEIFRKQIKIIEKKYNFIFDLSDIFDGMNNSYVDNCHVYESGNEIIANNILNHLRSVGEDI